MDKKLLYFYQRAWRRGNYRLLKSRKILDIFFVAQVTIVFIAGYNPEHQKLSHFLPTINFYKMKNLEQFDLQALDANELEEVQGGLIFLAVGIAIGFAAGLGAGIAIGRHLAK